MAFASSSPCSAFCLTSLWFFYWLFSFITSEFFQKGARSLIKKERKSVKSLSCFAGAKLFRLLLECTQTLWPGSSRTIDSSTMLFENRSSGSVWRASATRNLFTSIATPHACARGISAPKTFSRFTKMFQKRRILSSMISRTQKHKLLLLSQWKIQSQHCSIRKFGQICSDRI